MGYKILFSAHLCDETGAIIINPAVNQEVRVMPMIKTSLFEPEKPSEPDYSHLIGKWIYCNHEDIEGWVKVISCSSIPFPQNLVVQKNGRYDGLHISHFNLKDPRDTNPDEAERVIPFDIERWRSGDFVRVQTREGDEVTQLVWLDCTAIYPFVGVSYGNKREWMTNGRFLEHQEDPRDLILVIKGGEK